MPHTRRQSIFLPVLPSVRQSPQSGSIHEHLTPRSFSKRILALGAVAFLAAGCARTSQEVVCCSAIAAQKLRTASDLKPCQAAARAAAGLSVAATPNGSRGSPNMALSSSSTRRLSHSSIAPKELRAKAGDAGAGAMAGSITAVVLKWNEPDGVHRNYVDLCLEKRGHKSWAGADALVGSGPQRRPRPISPQPRALDTSP